MDSYLVYSNVIMLHLSLNRHVRPTVIFIFFTWLAASIALLPYVKVGLEQNITMPKDSYMIDYFSALKEYFAVGPPVYFVIKSGINYENLNASNLICASAGCSSQSMANQLGFASLRPSETRLAQIGTTWLDDYYDWLRHRGSTPCCRVNNATTGKLLSIEWSIKCSIVAFVHVVQHVKVYPKMNFDDFSHFS